MPEDRELRPTLRRGDEGDLVGEVQADLKVAVDGNFGPDTEAAVIQFQRDRGLDSDGVVGPRTWAALDALAGPPSPLKQITQMAERSALAHVNFRDRGRAPTGFVKGMALAYGRVYCKFKAGDATALDMAQKKTGDAARDALAWYGDVFSAAAMDNSVSGFETLRHLFVLLFGLGMRESSGKYCEGRDRSVNNTDAGTAEAGLFQTSFNARTASPLLPQIFAHYRANPSGFVDVFKEGVRCSAASLENFGSGDGMEFQRLSKECPAFATEFAALGLRHIRTHWGPITRKEAEVRPECDTLLSQVQAAIDSSPDLRSALV
jgi:Putative peptidoglycan binding domain